MFPRKIPRLNTEVTVNETGLTSPQMVALTAGIAVFNPMFLYHARRVCVDLFEKYPTYLRFFDLTPPDNKRLHAYAIYQFRFFADLIEQGLANTDMFKRKMSEYVNVHREYGMTLENIQNIMDVYKKYFQMVLSTQMSQTLESALDIFFDSVVKAYEHY